MSPLALLISTTVVIAAICAAGVAENRRRKALPRVLRVVDRDSRRRTFWSGVYSNAKNN